MERVWERLSRCIQVHPLALPDPWHLLLLAGKPVDTSASAPGFRHPKKCYQRLALALLRVLREAGQWSADENLETLRLDECYQRLTLFPLRDLLQIRQQPRHLGHET